MLVWTWWSAALERALTSFVIIWITLAVGVAFDWIDLDWNRVWALSAAVFAISILKSVASTAFTGQPSLNKSEVLNERKRRKQLDTEATDTDADVDPGAATGFGSDVSAL